MIDALESTRIDWLGLQWNQFSIYFAGLLGVLLVLTVLVARLNEEKAANLNELMRDFIATIRCVTGCAVNLGINPHRRTNAHHLGKALGVPVG